MPLKRRSGHPDEERETTERRDEAPPATDVQRVLAMQRSAGNQAVAATLARKVKINELKPPTISHKAKVPAMPDEIRNAHPTRVDELAAAAQAWVVHKDLKGEFATTLDFYKAIVKEVVGETADDGPSKRDRWKTLQIAVETPGTITPVPWARFKATEAAELERELLACPVQRSGGDSTAAHGNKHGKLPKTITTDDGRALDTLPKKDQMGKTPYFEFLIAGGHKKEHGGIERAIIDIDANRVWITAHYDEGSFAELVGVPASVVANWKLKVAAYKTEF